MLPALRTTLALVSAAILVATLAVTATASSARTSEASTTAAATAARSLPARAVWRADVRTALTGAETYLTERAAAAAPGEQLAINLDIDNTSLQTEYAKGRPVRPTLQLALRAQELGVAVLFNTGRRPALAEVAAAQLEKVGFPVDQVCSRVVGETLIEGKQRCRSTFREQGYTLVANVGNNATDFTGSDYERAFRLPNYRGQLG